MVFQQRVYKKIWLSLSFLLLSQNILSAQTLHYIMSPFKGVVLPQNSIDLSFLGVDPDSAIDTYAWQQSSGSSASISNPNQSSMTVNGLSAGFYTFELTVTAGSQVTEDQYTVRVFDPNSLPASPVITGELKKWHTLTFEFNGPMTSETSNPNPFYDMRFDVLFVNGNKQYFVPGYYAANGNAAETSAESGNKWHVKFTPDTEGTWHYYTSFRQGNGIAIGDSPQTSTPGILDGLTGSFIVSPTDKQKPDFRKQGRLNYVGKRFYQFEESKEYFLKGGADSPENFLAYVDFDDTYDLGGLPLGGSFLHEYQPHAQDSLPTDPSWQSGKGKNIMGAINYLAGKGMNIIYFLTYNIDDGDGRDVWMWTSDTERYRFDCSKLDQWEIVFSHMQKNGILMHVVTQEEENDQALDFGELGNMRRLYYRELIARFSHHLALQWNLGEENTNSNSERRSFARYFKLNDPYKHPTVIHTFPQDIDDVYTSLLGFKDLDGAGLQTTNTYANTIQWNEESGLAGHQWVVTLDEVAQWQTGVEPDSDDPEHNDIRKNYLWANLIGGGAGCEWYFGFFTEHSDLDCEDWRSRENMWDQTRYALEFFHTYLPFWQMSADNTLLSNVSAQGLIKPGEIYAIYLPNGGTTQLDLESNTDAYSVYWYNPRNAGALLQSNVTTIVGPGIQSLGDPPSDLDKDWVILVRSKCHSDYNFDGITNYIDHSFLASNWMQTIPGFLEFDCNNNQQYDFTEFLLLVQSWLNEAGF